MTFELILISFCVGVFSSMIGALPTFITLGFIVLAGSTGGFLNGANDFQIINQVAFGVLAPNISFASADAATMYATKKGFIKNFDMTIPLIKFQNTGILLVGGIFGVLGLLLNFLFLNILNLTTDTMALSVVFSGIIARLLFSTKGLSPSLKNRNKIFPRNNDLKLSILLSLSIGSISSYCAIKTGDIYLFWALSAVTLIFKQMGHGGYPFHHIGIISALAGVTTNNLYIGMIFGIFAGLISDTFDNIFNKEADSHIDPQATSIAILTTVILLFLN